jgi:hypothetical protein
MEIVGIEAVRPETGRGKAENEAENEFRSLLPHNPRRELRKREKFFIPNRCNPLKSLDSKK